MIRNGAKALAVALLVGATACPAAAQQPLRVRGTIQKVEGAQLVVKAGEAADVTVTVADNARVFGVRKATIHDVKPGDFIGVGAEPQPDGTQRAIQVTIFAESQRGTGEGHRPWDRPNATMTNAAVETTVAGVNGQEMTVKYRMGERTGEQKIVIPPNAVMRAYVPSERSELKVGASIAIMNAVRKPDGTLEASRINVGRDGIVP
jgi:hypothetical protein